jgi:hypothetical protein
MYICPFGPCQRGVTGKPPLHGHFLQKCVEARQICEFTNRLSATGVAPYCTLLHPIAPLVCAGRKSASGGMFTFPRHPHPGPLPLARERENRWQRLGETGSGSGRTVQRTTKTVLGPLLLLGEKAGLRASVAGCAAFQASHPIAPYRTLSHPIAPYRTLGLRLPCANLRLSFSGCLE